MGAVRFEEWKFSLIVLNHFELAYQVFPVVKTDFGVHAPSHRSYVFSPEVGNIPNPNAFATAAGALFASSLS